jgi:hypothetical protein
MSADLQQASLAMLTAAGDIVATSGEDRETMEVIGQLMLDLSRSGVLEGLLGSYPGSDPAVIDLLGAAHDGSKLLLYRMDGWQSPAVADAHWHNYWQSLLVVHGRWEDTVWRPVGEVSGGLARTVRVDRHEIIRTGGVQVLGPDEPHGWEAHEARRANGLAMLMWAGSARGRPRMVLHPQSGSVSEEYGHLNPAPAATS